MMTYIKKILKIREVGVLIPLLLLWIITGIANPAFFSKVNMIALFRTTSITLLGSIGAAFIFSCGMMDVSAGSVYAFSGMVTAMMMKQFNLPVIPAILCGLGIGLIFGLFNAGIVTKIGLPPFIATLGTQYIARGLCNVLTKGEAITSLPEGYNALGGFGPLHIPYSVYISLLLAAVVYVVFRFTTFGRSVLATGGNRETARVCGVNVQKVSVLCFVIAGLFYSLAGIIATARLGTAQASAASGWEMTIIAACIIGGVSMYGGSVTIVGVIIGTLLMETLTVSMTMLKVNAFWQRVAIGIVIILAVTVDTYRRKKMSGGQG